MSKLPFISRITSDVLDREKNALVTANTLGKIFSGKLENDLDFDTLIHSGCYRFDDTATHGPQSVTSGYILVHGINPDYNLANIVRIRQIAYADTGSVIMTRTGSAPTLTSTVTWSPWTAMGGSGAYLNYVKLTNDTLGECATYYRSFNSFVLTLPDPTTCKDGNTICLEQNVTMGIVIDSSKVSAKEGKLLYDETSKLLFQQHVTSGTYLWNLIEDATVTPSADKSTYTVVIGTVTKVYPASEIIPTTETIEYVIPDAIGTTLHPKRFLAYISTNEVEERVWVVDSDIDLSEVIKTLVDHITVTNNDLIKYVNDNDAPYHLYRLVTPAGIHGVFGTLYRAYENDTVLTLPDPSLERIGRWVGLEQHATTPAGTPSIGYVVDAHRIPVTTEYVYDTATTKLFRQITSEHGARWVIVAPKAGQDLPSLVNTDFKVVKVDATTTGKVFEAYTTKDASDAMIWVHYDLKTFSKL